MAKNMAKERMGLSLQNVTPKPRPTVRGKIFAVLALIGVLGGVGWYKYKNDDSDKKLEDKSGEAAGDAGAGFSPRPDRPTLPDSNTGFTLPEIDSDEPKGGAEPEPEEDTRSVEEILEDERNLQYLEQGDEARAILEDPKTREKTLDLARQHGLSFKSQQKLEGIFNLVIEHNKDPSVESFCEVWRLFDEFKALDDEAMTRFLKDESAMSFVELMEDQGGLVGTYDSDELGLCPELNTDD